MSNQKQHKPSISESGADEVGDAELYLVAVPRLIRTCCA